MRWTITGYGGFSMELMYLNSDLFYADILAEALESWLMELELEDQIS